MKSDRIQSAIGEIDADLIEAAEQEGTSMKHKTSFARVGLLAACLALVVLAATAVPKLLNRPGDDPNPPASNTGELCEGGGTDGKINIHAEIKPSGADCFLSNEEAYAYVQENLPSWESGWIAMNDTTGEEDFRISPTGYSHIRTGNGGNELILNARDFLIYNGDELFAIATVIKEPGMISGSPAWGSPWFPEYQAFLEAHRGEALVYLYVGDVEAILTPDGQVVTRLSLTEGSDALRSNIVPEEQAQYYEFFRREENSYTP